MRAMLPFCVLLLLLTACEGGRVDRDVNVGVDKDVRVGVDVIIEENETNVTVDPRTPVPAQIDASTTLAQGTFIGNEHATSGTARLTARGTLLTLELSEFSVDRGPDLRVYLASNDAATDILDLGTLQRFNGYQVYVVPQGTDISRYDRVLIWCEAFSVLFGSARFS